MSEYWKSTPKYWCKHCTVYVKDTPFERKQHESTAKHEGNLKRFLRGIQNDHERAEREKEKVKAEVDRLNKVVGAGSSIQSSSQSKSNAARIQATQNPTVVDQKRQWAQLAEMGIQVPDQFRAEMAMSGKWQTVSSEERPDVVPEHSLSTGVRKRKADDAEDQAEEINSGSGGHQKRGGWGTAIRRYPGSIHSDLDTILSDSVLEKRDFTKPKVETEDKATVPAPSADRISAISPIDETDAKVKIENAIDTQSEVQTLHPQTADTNEDQKQGFGVAELDGNDTQQLAVPVFKKRRPKPKT